jgi:beta-glucanase (GH16 family)
VWPARKVNDEDQAYTDRPENARLEDGMLVIEAHREEYDDAEYTSARIHSSGKGDFLYGRFEIRAKLPRGQGTWPAIWMLPSDPFAYATNCEEGEWQGNSDCDAWPNSGEIDIMEHVGYQMNHVHGTVHTKAYFWQVWEQRKGRIILDDVADAFHVYAIEWTPERIDAFVDDTLYFTYVNEQKGWEEWPFDKPFFLIMNVAVGGAWGRAGGPIDETVFPQKMLVDWVRVYQAGG